MSELVDQEFHKGDRVRVSDSESQYFGQVGTVEYSSYWGAGYDVRFDNGDYKPFDCSSVEAAPDDTGWRTVANRPTPEALEALGLEMREVVTTTYQIRFKEEK